MGIELIVSTRAWKPLPKQQDQEEQDERDATWGLEGERIEGDDEKDRVGTQAGDCNGRVKTRKKGAKEETKI